MPHHSLQAQAENKLRIADHLLSTTYPMVKEPKLLVSVAENLLQAVQHAIDAALVFDERYKNLTHETWSARMDMFRRKIITKYSLDPKIMDFILELTSLVENHKKSGVEFTKNEKFVITDNDYNLKTLSFDDIRKKYLQAKHYIQDIFNIISRYD